MMIQAVLGNPHHPEYGVATIPFPIPRDQHAHCMELLEALEIGDAVKADCKVEKIDSFYTVLKRVEMLTVNVEELNYLAKRLDSFDTGEAAQFQAMAHKLELFELKDLINLTFCCQQATVITDFSDLAAIGRDHYMNLHGGSASVDELNALDGKKTARQLIESGKVIELPSQRFQQFSRALLADYDFIAENKNAIRHDDDARYCLLILDAEGKDGFLVDPQGHNYARYSAFVPNARSLLTPDMGIDRSYLSPAEPWRDESRDEMLRITLRVNGKPDYTLILPADEEYLDAVKAYLDIDVFADAMLCDIRFKVPYIGELMIRHCRQKKIDVILTKSVSRFSRNTVDCLYYIRALKQLGIAVIFEKENINSLEEDSELRITLSGAFAQSESESISANVTWGKRRAMEAGKVSIQYKKLYGYRKGEDGQPEIIPEQAEIVRWLYERYLTGASLRMIKDELEQ